MLSALAVDNAKPRETDYLLADGNGLHLLVSAKGAKLWRLRYRFAGKQKMISLGVFPEVTLAQATVKRDEARKLLSEGINPSEQRKLEKLGAEVAGRNTFGAVAEEYLKRLEDSGVAEATLNKNRWLLTNLALLPRLI